MSFNLVVFDPASAPRFKEAFLRWYEEQAQWSEGHAYDDVSRAATGLQAWYRDLITAFPPTHGPDAPEEGEFEDACQADYLIGSQVIHVAFGWSKAVTALQRVQDLARLHAVGFFNVSSMDKNLWVPDGKGELKEIKA
jgi:hypothetical protein